MIFEKLKITILDFSKIRFFQISKMYPKFFEIWNAVTFSLLDRFWKFWMFQKALDLYFPTGVPIFRIPSGKPPARLPTRCRWDWVLRDVRWVWIRFRRILSLNQPESSQNPSNISKIKNIHSLRIEILFSTYLLRRMRCRTTRLWFRWLCTKSLATLTSLPEIWYRIYPDVSELIPGLFWCPGEAMVISRGSSSESLSTSARDVRNFASWSHSYIFDITDILVWFFESCIFSLVNP